MSSGGGNTRKKARVAAAVKHDDINPAMKCPICYLVIFASKNCAKGHVICGACFEVLDKQQPRPPSPPICPLCRTHGAWYPNLLLDQVIEQQHPKEYARRMLLTMEWPALKAYILREIDPDFCYEQTEPTDVMNIAMHITAIKQVLKMAQVAGFADYPDFQVPENLSSMVYSFLPVTGFVQYGGGSNTSTTTMTPREHLKRLLAHACLLYNSVGYFIKKQYFLVVCRYRFDDTADPAADDDISI